MVGGGGLVGSREGGKGRGRIHGDQPAGGSNLQAPSQESGLKTRLMDRYHIDIRQGSINQHKLPQFWVLERRLLPETSYSETRDFEELLPIDAKWMRALPQMCRINRLINGIIRH